MKSSTAFLIRLRRRPRALPVDECEDVFCFDAIGRPRDKALRDVRRIIAAKRPQENMAAKQNI
jgi:hypothetical protein